jgi:hypothetical protein
MSRHSAIRRRGRMTQPEIQNISELLSSTSPSWSCDQNPAHYKFVSLLTEVLFTRRVELGYIVCATYVVPFLQPSIRLSVHSHVAQIYS